VSIRTHWLRKYRIVQNRGNGKRDVGLVAEDVAAVEPPLTFLNDKG